MGKKYKDDLKLCYWPINNLLYKRFCNEIMCWVNTNLLYREVADLRYYAIEIDSHHALFYKLLMWMENAQLARLVRK